MRSSRLRVLVVDDTDDVRELYAEHLMSCGYEVIQAADGKQALALVFEARPAIIVMDLAMPIMDGRTATRLLKCDPRSRAVPIIVVTGNAAPDQLRGVQDAGCDAILLKPCAPDALSVAIAHLLRGERVPRLVGLR